MKSVLIAIVMSFVAVPAMAADISWIEVDRDGSRVDVRAEFVIEAPVADVFAALLSYDKFAQMGDTFADSRYVEPAADGMPRIYTRTEGCIVFFCKTIERYARLETTAQQKIVAIAEPERSDAESSIESWVLTADGDATVIEYRHELDTGFWIPPLLGSMIISKSVKHGARKAADRIESIARTEGRVTVAQNQTAPADQT